MEDVANFIYKPSSFTWLMSVCNGGRHVVCGLLTVSELLALRLTSKAALTENELIQEISLRIINDAQKPIACRRVFSKSFHKSFGSYPSSRTWSLLQRSLLATFKKLKMFIFRRGHDIVQRAIDQGPFFTSKFLSSPLLKSICQEKIRKLIVAADECFIHAVTEHILQQFLIVYIPDIVSITTVSKDCDSCLPPDDHVVQASRSALFKSQLNTIVAASAFHYTRFVPLTDVILEQPSRSITPMVVITDRELLEPAAFVSLRKTYRSSYRDLLLINCTEGNDLLSQVSRVLRERERLVFVGSPEVTSIPHQFLQGSDYMESVDLLDMQSVTSIGNDFCYHCVNLQSFHISHMPCLTSVGKNFLAMDGVAPLLHRNNDVNLFAVLPWKRFDAIDFSGLCHVTKIDDGFLKGCASLHDLDLSPLSNLTTVNDSFLSGCTRVETISLFDKTEKNSSLKTIGNSFLKNCYNITTLNLSRLTSVECIGRDFMTNCCNLITLDLSAFSKLIELPAGFLQGCQKLQSVTFGDGKSGESGLISNVTTIDASFLSGCCSLIDLEIGSLVNLTHIGNGFLQDCSSLEFLDFRKLTMVTSIGSGFLAGCDKLESVYSGCSYLSGAIRVEVLS